MNDFMLLIAPFIIIELVLKAIALTDLYRQEHVSLPKWGWLLIILFVNTIGPILYFLFGKRRTVSDR
ncbi:hypothetical protein JCM19037_1987 [Geomicrobium sp. JCM 19037]|nr:hypothetical protein JCM19037_1987 [Geomicrobium sp. JCM 19037]